MNKSELRCLSVQQPYAEWIISGLKRVENRSWPTEYRGPLLIHASSKPAHTDEQTLWEAEQLGQTKDFLERLSTKSIVGCVQMVGVISRIREDGRVRGPGEFQKELQMCLKPHGEKLDRKLLTQQTEWHYDFRSEFWWIIAKPVRFKTFIPCKGALRLWKPSEDVLDEIDLASKGIV